jgi:hypothetical protein
MISCSETKIKAILASVQQTVTRLLQSLQQYFSFNDYLYCRIHTTVGGGGRAEKLKTVSYWQKIVCNDEMFEPIGYFKSPRTNLSLNSFTFCDLLMQINHYQSLGLSSS